MRSFWEGFFKQAGTLNEMMGNPFGNTENPSPPPPPPPPPPPAGNVSQGQTLGQRIGYPGS